MELVGQPTAPRATSACRRRDASPLSTRSTARSMPGSSSTTRMRADLMTTARAAGATACGTTTRTLGAVAGLALNRERAVHFPEHRAADRQAEAVAVRLRGEERLEHPRQVLGRESRIRCRRSRFRRARSTARAVTVIRPPCGVASRALVSRFRNTCSRSLWLQATSGMSSGTFDVQLDAAPAHAVLQDGRRRLDGAPHVSVAAAPRGVPRKRQHPAKDPAAHLERLLHVLEILGEHGGRRARRCAGPPASAGSAAASTRARCSRRETRSGPDRPSRACARPSRTRARSDSVRCRFWMAMAACDRKCSTSSASNGFSCSG